MSPAMASGLIVGLSVALALAAVLAGAIAWSARAATRNLEARWLRPLLDRLERIESGLDRIQAGTGSAGDARPVGSLDGVEPGRDGPARRAHSPATLIAVPNLGQPPALPVDPGAEPPPSDAWTRRFGDVWSLAERNMPVEAIARATGCPIGQVELIVGLRRKALAQSSGAAPR
jgi:hypothetical protein